MSDDPITNMRGRAQQCRRLANSIADRETVGVLLQMANDIEKDIKRLEKERADNASGG